MAAITVARLRFIPSPVVTEAQLRQETQTLRGEHMGNGDLG